jgi:hypothetical protein
MSRFLINILEMFVFSVHPRSLKLRADRDDIQVTELDV